MKVVDRVLDWFFSRVFPTVHHSHFNWYGPLPQNVTWEWASKNISSVPGEISIGPSVCPACRSHLIHQPHDRWAIIDSNGETVWQYMVHTWHCPYHHGAWVEWA